MADKNKSSILTPDICIIGAGSGGLVVASAAAQFGVEVVLIEKGKMGGDCLNYGCVPSKAIIASAKHAQAIRKAPEFGVSSGEKNEPKANFRQIHDHIHGVIDTIAPMDSVERFESLGVQVIQDHAKFIDKKTVQAGDVTIRARRFVVATGSSPFVPPIPGIEEVEHETNESLFNRKKNPGHLIVIGGGPIGMEMAQAHRRLGCKVTVVEGERALGKDDPECADIVLEAVRGEGVDIREGAKVVRVENVQKTKSTGVRVHISTDRGEEAIEGDTLLVATGRAANVSGLGLDKAGIDHTRRGIKVSKQMRTSNSRAYAVGDVAGSLQFTHMAGYHAGLVIRNILFRLSAKENTHIIPWATYTQPELAHVGHTEATAREANVKDLSVLRWPYAENDRAQAEHKTNGLIKIIVSKGGKIEGVTIAGEMAGEMINMWALAITKGLKLSDVTAYVPPYPTMSEIGKRAANTYFAPKAKKPIVQKIVKFLQKFG